MKMHALQCGDCQDLLQAVPEASIDLVFTSPPYAQQRKKEYNSVSPESYAAWFLSIAHEIFRILKPSGSFFLNLKAHCARGERHLYVYKLVIALQEICRFKFIDEYIWYKSAMPRIKSARLWDAWEPIWFFSKGTKPYINHERIRIASSSTFGNKRGWASRNRTTGNVGGFHDVADQVKGFTQPDNVLYFPTALMGKDKDYEHPAKFPVELADFIARGYCPPGGTVCDPFMGSGVVGLAALQNGNKFIGMELDQKYYEMTQQRLEVELIGKIGS